MTDNRWVGDRLKRLREAAGLTQQQLADKAGCTWGTVSRWERGEREPGWSQIVALSEALGCSCEAFREEGPAVGAGEAPAPPEEKPKPGRPRKGIAPATAEEPPSKPRKKKGDA